MTAMSTRALIFIITAVIVPSLASGQAPSTQSTTASLIDTARQLEEWVEKSKSVRFQITNRLEASAKTRQLKRLTGQAAVPIHGYDVAFDEHRTYFDHVIPAQLYRRVSFWDGKRGVTRRTARGQQPSNATFNTPGLNRIGYAEPGLPHSWTHALHWTLPLAKNPSRVADPRFYPLLVAMVELLASPATDFAVVGNQTIDNIPCVLFESPIFKSRLAIGQADSRLGRVVLRSAIDGEKCNEILIQLAAEKQARIVSTGEFLIWYMKLPAGTRSQVAPLASKQIDAIVVTSYDWTIGDYTEVAKGKWLSMSSYVKQMQNSRDEPGFIAWTATSKIEQVTIDQPLPDSLFILDASPVAPPTRGSARGGAQ